MSATLLELALRHDYYEDGHWHHARVVPDAATAALMARLGLMGAAEEGSFRLLYFGARTREDFLAYTADCVASTLTFLLHTPDENFFSMTDLPLQARGRLGFSTSRTAGDATRQGPLSLLPVYAGQASAGTVVGEVEVRLDDLLTPAALAAGGRYLIGLGARSTQWRYCIVNRSQRPFDDPVVTAGDITFEKPDATTLAGEAALLFSSGSTRLPLRQRQMRTFSLVNGGGHSGARRNKSLIPCLPIAAPGATMFEQLQDGLCVYSQMNVYL